MGSSAFVDEMTVRMDPAVESRGRRAVAVVVVVVVVGDGQKTSRKNIAGSNKKMCAMSGRVIFGHSSHDPSVSPRCPQMEH